MCFLSSVSGRAWPGHRESCTKGSVSQERPGCSTAQCRVLLPSDASARRPALLLGYNLPPHYPLQDVSASSQPRLSAARSVFTLLGHTAVIWDAQSGATAWPITALDSTGQFGSKAAYAFVFPEGGTSILGRSCGAGGPNRLITDEMCECKVCVCVYFGHVCLNTHNPTELCSEWKVQPH